MPASAVFAFEVNWNNDVFGNGQSAITPPLAKGQRCQSAAIESFDLDVCYQHGLLVDRLAFQSQAERLFVPSCGRRRTRSRSLARTVSPVKSVASTPCSFCVNVASALPNSASPPRARRRSRKIVSVRACGTIQRLDKVRSRSAAWMNRASPPAARRGRSESETSGKARRRRESRRLPRDRRRSRGCEAGCPCRATPQKA